MKPVFTFYDVIDDVGPDFDDRLNVHTIIIYSKQLKGN